MGRGLAPGVTMSVKNILLGNSLERDLDRLNLGSTSKAILAFPHGNSKGEEHVFNVVGWVEATVCRPCTPVAVAFGGVNCRSSNCLPRNVFKTLDFS